MKLFTTYGAVTTVLILLCFGLGCEEATRQPEKLVAAKPVHQLEPTRSNVVLISIDTLRSDHLGAWGFPAGYSGTLDRMGGTGFVRQSVYTTIPHTTPGHASLLTGRYPVNHGCRDNAFPVDGAVPTLAESLLMAGYRTGGSVAHFLISGPTSGLNRGFEFYEAPPEPGLKPSITEGGKKVYPLATNTFRPWKQVNLHAKKWLEQTHEPFFLFLHYYECHAPHTPEFPLNRLPGRNPELKLYDGEVAAVDRAISDVMSMLAERNVLRNTEIIVTADHGESLGEHGYTGHGMKLYYPSMGIPWINWEGQALAEKRVIKEGQALSGGAIRRGIHRIIDIMPSILAQRDIPLPLGLDGKPDAVGVTEAFGESPGLYASEPQRRIRCVRDRLATMIYHPRNKHIELYDRERDPGETLNLSAARQEQAREYEQKIETLMKDDTETLLKPGETLKPAVVDALKSLGYL